jgi:hypothetical protein
MSGSLWHCSRHDTKARADYNTAANFGRILGLLCSIVQRSPRAEHFDFEQPSHLPPVACLL